MPDRPNILVVMGDDHAQWALGCYGNRELRTPTMDYLAETGVCFANAFTPTPVCSPARASFFTGRLPSQHGVQDWLKEGATPHVDWLADETTLVELLKEHGYQTGLVGKWHCGDRRAPGFDYWFSYQEAQYPHRGECRFVEDDSPLVYHGYQTPYLTGEAVEFLRRRDRHRPFFLFVGYVDTHGPFSDHPERLVRFYRRCDFADVPIEQPSMDRGWVRFGLPLREQDRREWLAQYYAGVTMIDEQLSVLLDELDGGGHDNTLVLYTSDHGHMNGQHGLYTKGNATVPQNFYEESIRVPCLLWWLQRITAAQVSLAFIDHCDLFQTLLDAAGCQPDAEAARARRYPGRSVLPLLDDPNQKEWRAVQFCEYGNARMIRTPQFKLVRHYQPHAGVYPDELYDLIADPREATNLIGAPSLATLVHELDSQLEGHFGCYEDPERSATRILDQPSFNAYEPWRLQPPRARSGGRGQ